MCRGETVIKVSVVVPVYNVEKYLNKCLDSLVNQTLDEIEIIVVNDGATDGSQMIIDEYVKTYPHKVRGLIKKNGGLSDARNYGIPYCSGEYIGFVDSDDYVDHNMYEKMYNIAVKDNSDMVTCDYYMVYGDDRLQRVSSRDYTNRKEMFIAARAAAWNKLYRREMINKEGLTFPKGLIYEDTLFYASCIPHINRVSYVQEPLIYYVQRSGSIANTQGNKTQQIFDIFGGIIQYYQDKSYWDEYEAEIEYYCTRIAFGSNLERISRISDAKLRHELSVKTMQRIKSSFPNYKKNVYIRSTNSFRHIFIQLLSEKNIRFVSDLLYIVYQHKDRRLFR